MNKWYIYCKKGDFAAISKEFGISAVTARLLINRNIRTYEDIRSFLHADRSSLHDPFLFDDMKKAVEMTADAVKAQKKIRIIGDYDADGVCASIILKKFLQYIGADVDVRIPDRISDGYGMNANMVCEAKRDNVALIITCDNGISAIEAVNAAAEYGIKVIITDHHEPGSIIPHADAVICAKLQGSSYPYRDLCGASVAYKFDQALLKYVLSEEHFVWPENNDAGGALRILNNLLQFAGIATVTDIVPLTGENRIIVKEALKIIASDPNIGLSELAFKRGLSCDNINSFNIGFVIGPCINAAGRLDNAKKAFDLFDTESKDEAAYIAAQLSELNEERKRLTSEQAQAASDIIEEKRQKNGNLPQVIVIYLPYAHESVAGIIAGRLKEKYNRPSLVLTNGEGGLKGSGRSVPEYDLIEALRQHGEMFSHLGGHAAAAGFTCICSADELADALNADDRVSQLSFEKKVWIDMQLPFEHVSFQLIEEIEMLEPFGMANDRPIFALKDVRFSNARLIGKELNVLKMRMFDAVGGSIEGIYFGCSDEEGLSAVQVDSYLKTSKDEQLFTILYRPSVNEFRGNKSLQAVIEEIRIQGDSDVHKDA